VRRTGWIISTILSLAALPIAADDELRVELSPVVSKLLSEKTTADAQRRRLAIFHGQWDTLTDLTTAEEAQIALRRYDLNHEALREDEAPLLVVAEAALLRGEAERVLELIAQDPSAQGAMLRAEALRLIGRGREALEQIDPWRRKLQDENITSAAELTAAARGLVFMARHEGRPAQDYHNAIGLLGKARDDLDRLYWPAHVAEAELLLTKSNARESREAALAALQLNPRCGAAWFIMGRIALYQLDFPQAAKCTGKLREINPKHLLADLLETHSRLMQRDPEAAIRVVETALKNTPEQRELIALLAACEALRFNEEGFKAALARFAERSPGNPLAHYTAGRYLSAARQYRSAERMFDRCIELDPNWPEPQIDLGLMLLQSGDEPEALRILRGAVELDPFHTRAGNSLKLAEHLVDYEKILTPHFVIKYRKGIDEVLARDIESQIESIYDLITATYRHRPRRKTLIEILPNAQWFAVRITGMPWIWTIGACTGDVIALTPPRHGKKQRGTFDWHDVIRHEFVHTVTLDQTDNRVPHWFTEACGVSSQNTRRDYDGCRLLAAALQDGKLFALDQINWAFVRPRSPSDRPLAYAQADWMLEYITEQFGHEVVITMLQAYGRGASDTESLLEAAQTSTEEFMSQFKQWAGEQVRRWGLQRRDDDDPKIAQVLAGETPDDQTQLEKLLARHGEHPDLLKAYAARTIQHGPPDVARQVVLRYAAARPVDPWSSRALATLALRTGRLHEAIGPLQRLDSLELKVADWAHQLAKLHRAAGRFAAAAAAMNRALRREPYNAAFRELTAAIELQRNKPNDALVHVSALTLIEPNRALHWTRLAALQHKLGRNVEAAHAARKARQIDKDAPVEKYLSQ